jgi:hypothetical protein
MSIETCGAMIPSFFSWEKYSRSTGPRQLLRTQRVRLIGWYWSGERYYYQGDVDEKARAAKRLSDDESYSTTEARSRNPNQTQLLLQGQMCPAKEVLIYS